MEFNYLVSVIRLSSCEFFLLTVLAFYDMIVTHYIVEAIVFGLFPPATAMTS